MSSNTFLMPNDLSDLCRVCLQLPEESQYLDLTTIYDEEDNLTYGECFTICTQINLSDGEGVPHHLCKSCGLELQMTYDFYKKVEESKRVIEQCQKRIEKKSLNASGQQNRTSCDIKQQHDTSLAIADNYVTSACIDATIPSQKDSGLRPQNIMSISDVQESNEFGIVKKNDQNKFREQQEEAALSDKIQIESSQESNAGVDIEEHFTMDDYQNVETLEEEELNTFEEVEFTEDNEKPLDTNKEQIPIENISIEPYIPPGIRLPLPNGPPFICEFCGHNSPTKALLSSHRHRKHRLKDTLYDCDKCLKQFKSKELHEKHMKRLSCQGYPEFTCEYCSKKLIGSANYKIHLRFHQKVYPFKCEFCNKSFMLSVHLKAHIQTKHENKRFTCEEPNCGKFFQSLQSLKAHIYTHVGSMPYCCEYCARRYPNKGRLRWHLKHSHGLEISLNDLDHMMVADEISIKAAVKCVELNN